MRGQAISQAAWWTSAIAAMFPTSRMKTSRRACRPKHRRLASTNDSRAARASAGWSPNTRTAGRLGRSAAGLDDADADGGHGLFIRGAYEEAEVVGRGVEVVGKRLIGPRVDGTLAGVTLVAQAVHMLAGVGGVGNTAGEVHVRNSGRRGKKSATKTCGMMYRPWVNRRTTKSRCCCASGAEGTSRRRPGSSNF